ncbi:hypothetical protein FH063_005144 [Azospirillum argentinense]|uniref:Uncharacterized protein n=1 Tax=Azospirillum argentinense TaxID=2970906 RepID=A0A5B0KVV8_9PROT|nr:hypothetical protein FH063_005144 [Azospirillum argentinense]
MLPVSAAPVRIGVVLLLSAVVTVGALGAVVSMVRDWVLGADVLPAVSVAVAATALVPLGLRLNEPEVGVAVARLRLQVPLVAVVV